MDQKEIIHLIESMKFEKRIWNSGKVKKYRVIRYDDDSFLVSKEKKNKYSILLLREKRENGFVYIGKGNRKKVDKIIHLFIKKLKERNLYFERHRIQEMLDEQ